MMTKRFANAALLFAVASYLGAACRSSAVLANAWHIPDDSSDLGFNMRSPEFEIGTNTTVTIYEGLQRLNNSYGTANQTGGTLFYKGLTQSSWSSAGLLFYSNSGNNQYWQASFNSSSFGSNDVIQYYLYLTFDGVNGLQNSYLYGGDGASTGTTNQAAATNAPFTIRNRPAWLFHANNRVINNGTNPNQANVDFWVKIGYLGKDNSSGSRWVDNARVYYTTDGTTPTGALGQGSNTSQVAALVFNHPESNPSPAGDAMWWAGTVTNLPTFTPINYKISAWNSANNEEKFADYNAGTPNTIFSFQVESNGDPVLTVNGVNANYTTTHVFVDEVAGTSNALTILFSPNQPNLTAVEVFSNLNRRDRATMDANGDGIEDGILPPDGNGIAAGDDSNYYKAYTMTPTSTPGQYSLTLNAQKTGAYRLTARFKVSGNPNWNWYTSNGRRDHAIVVSPQKARNMIVYELNAMNIGSQGTQDYQRSTFVDLYNGPGSRPYDPVTNRFNLAYATNLGVNWLWFQPIHPIGIDGREIDPNSNQPYAVGSPYSVKNFFQINPLLGKAGTRDAALIEFTNFVAAADAAGLNVMLDEPFNHTAYDCELDASGVFYFSNNAQPTSQIRSNEARFFSRTNNYDMRAYNADSVAAAPDRYDFGKWPDVHDVFFGRYSALVPNSSAVGNFVSEADSFDYSIGSEGSSGPGNGHFDGITQNVWKYFSDCVLYWLDKTGCPAGTPANQTSKGIDGLRADFGQGLPPQCWEYIVNKVRSRKWDFVFMSESLDGGAVTYRSNRHFDVLNENVVFDLQAATTASAYRNLFEARRNAYGQGLVLLNTTSHDEQSYSDPFQALVRHAVCGAIDGAPMIFYGEELGISTYFGFDRYEGGNFGKTVPQFKDYNSLQPIFHNRANGVDYLWPVYAAINQARNFSRALRSSNRYFLDQTGAGGPQQNIFSVAKYEQANGSPNFYDVVFAFANLDRSNPQQGNFNVNITQNGTNLFGIKSGRSYNVRNIAAYTGFDPNRRNYFLIPSNVSGANLLNNGLYVALNPAPGSNDSWTNAPYEAQYLKLYDVTPPPTPAALSTPKPYVLSTNVTFTWPPVADPDGGVLGYHVIVGTYPGSSNIANVIVNVTNLTVNSAFGTVLYAQVSVINNAGIEGSMSQISTGTLLLDPASIVLGAASAPGGLKLTWPPNLSNSAILYSTTNLVPPNWSPVPGNPVLTNHQGMITVPVTPDPSHFYRLQLN